jgi:hypothetical protein
LPRKIVTRKQKRAVTEKASMLILIHQASLDSLRGIVKGARMDSYRQKDGILGTLVSLWVELLASISLNL